MDWYLVSFEKNWADEFDVEGFCIMTGAEYDLVTKIIEEIGDDVPFEFHFGTNEGWEGDETVKEVWENDFTVKKISCAVHVAALIYETLLEGKYGKKFGIIPDFGDMCDMFDTHDGGNPLVEEYWNRYNKREFDVGEILEKTHFRGTRMFRK